MSGMGVRYVTVVGDVRKMSESDVGNCVGSTGRFLSLSGPSSGSLACRIIIVGLLHPRFERHQQIDSAKRGGPHSVGKFVYISSI